MRVAVLGAGSWGTVFAKVLADSGNDVVLWARRPKVAQAIEHRRRNDDYLPGVLLPAGIEATSDLPRALRGAEVVFLSVPSQSLRGLLRDVRPALEPTAIAVSLMKGVEDGTGARMSEVIRQGLALPDDRIAVVSGPNLALEIAREEPTAAVVASTSLDTAMRVASACANRYFGTFMNADVIGTEFGGVLKNLIALAVGIVVGVGYGDNTKASILTRGLAEMSAFAAAFGAQPDTLAGLAGMGDLIATSESPRSRNNRAGRLLGQGYTKDDVLRTMDQVAEGLASLEPVLALAAAKGVEMPICTQVSQVIAGTLDPRDIAPHAAADPLPIGE
ncbi:NAD(P)H-dependent glycerol-3-phosphate dehydrogenase [Amnibacterium kyonggiense]|uniref:Glycerol-3-phosphate dehydrogenase [NAD(P)+] n=1 Tax=Amnibacterium kyonggiense TaxID=595671 RepID=A0A4R7FT36_9MICO|nr:NAD(P)H-dependent glycerol-3-phosphate dehydrogenase [Amnibacterium kyonggiense]TDS80859.1 glycerol-3-phosphate dehydrogenase (NAD(P)+) [Amnibacterium kyonggiense]